MNLEAQKHTNRIEIHHDTNHKPLTLWTLLSKVLLPKRSAKMTDWRQWKKQVSVGFWTSEFASIWKVRQHVNIHIVKRSHLLSSHPQHFISFHFHLITLFHLWFDLKTTLHRVIGKTFLNCYIFSLTRTDKKWFLHDWSGKTLDTDSRYLINQVSISIFYVLKIVIWVLKMLF